jgi:hypothetical protein
MIWWKGIAAGERIRPDDRGGVEVECLACRALFKLRIRHTQMCGWLDGEELQDAIAGLTKHKRALLVVGYCGECYEKQFPLGEQNWVQ